MNKGRITYRFDSNGRRISQDGQQMQQEQQKARFDAGDTVELDTNEMIVLDPSEAIELPDDEATAVYEINDSVPIQSNESPKKLTEMDELKTSHDTQFLNQFTNDFGAWSSPFDTETEKLERLIRQTEEKPLKKLESESAPPNIADEKWPFPEKEADFSREDEITYSRLWHTDAPTDQPKRTSSESGAGREFNGPESISGATIRYIRRSSKSWMKIFTSFTGAVVTGLVLGILVLTFFSGNEEPAGTMPDNDIPGLQTDMPPVDHTSQDGDAGNEITPPDGSAITVQLPAQSYVLLQNGVFTTKEAAESAVAALRGKGFAAAMMEGEQYYVFAGILNNRDDALALSRVLQTNDFETFIKTIDIAAVSSLNWGVSDRSLVESYFEQAERLVQMLINFSAIHLQNGASSRLEATSIESVKNTHQTWSAIAHDLAAEANEEVKPFIEQMNNELNTAVLAMEEYNKSPAVSYQWQVQHSVMQFIFQYEQLTLQ